MKQSKSIAIYTPDVFNMTHPGATEEDYNAANNRNIILDRLFSENSELDSIKFVIIDEKYIQWLNRNRLENSGDARKQYVQSLNEKKLNALWEKYGMHEEIRVFCLPVKFMFSKPTTSHYVDLSINIENLKRIEKKIAAECGIPENQLMVYHNIFSPNTLLDEEACGKIMNMAQRYLCFNDFLKYDEFKVQEVPVGMDAAILFMLVGYRKIIPREVTRNFYNKNIRKDPLLDTELNIAFISKQLEKGTITYNQVLSTNILTVGEAFAFADLLNNTM